jgi:hypothetical protein
MTTLLVLGSKPEPALPPRDSFDEVACANASGHSARRHALPDPTFTVVSAILTSGKKPANALALQAMRGLRTGTVYLYPRPAPRGAGPRRLVRRLRDYRVSPLYVRLTLRRIGFRYDRFLDPGLEQIHDLFRRLCGDDPAVLAAMADKQPSSGLLALALGIADGRYSRFVLSGFSFEITHAYADNPLIAKRGATSLHAGTDIAVLRSLAARTGAVYTTETVVQERAGIPLLPRLSPLPAVAE